MKQNLFNRVLEIARQRNLKPYTEQSIEWFRKKALTVSRGEARRSLLNKRKAPSFGTGTAIGKFYTFLYDPKHADKLPYYDRFPLGIFMGPVKNGDFAMLNLHYLPPKARAILIQKLLDLTNNTRYDEKTKFRLTYQLLNGASQYKLFRPCYKHYLFSHMKSNPVWIPFDEAELAIFLPVADFEKASNTKVWSDSIQKAK